MPTSDEELQQEAERVQDLRLKVQNAEADRINTERERSNDLAMAQLQAEAASLEARLAVVSRNADASAEQGSNAPIDAAKEQLRLAVASKEAAEADPNEGANADNGDERTDTEEK